MKYLVTSDIHLGHKNTPTEHIIRSFKTHILNVKNKDIDVLFIAGDLFDHLLYLNTKEAQQSIAFIHHLLDYCWVNDITLCVLEGTPSHDWHQSATIVKINNLRDNKINLHYQKTLSISYLEQLQKYVLYIPDEWCKSQQELETQVNEQLALLGIEKVDIAILHGQFRYQLQGRPTHAFCYDEAYFLALVRERIHIGHYHIYSEFDRIIANGSLERLAHGEEMPKGYLRVDNGVAMFIENPDAYTYITIAVSDKTTQAKLDKQIKALRPYSHVRLRMSRDCTYNTIFQELKVRYGDYYLKKLIDEDASGASTATYINEDSDIDFADNLFLETNIYEALMMAVSAKHVLTEREMTKLTQYAQVFIPTTEGAA